MSRPRLGTPGSGPEFLGGKGTPGSGGWEAYDFAVIRVVPHVHLENHVNVGVVLHGRSSHFIQAEVLSDRAALERLVPGTDVELLVEYLETFAGIARGEEAFGPMALSPPSERFHWLTAPRSDVIQCSAVRAGRSQDLETTVSDLYTQYVVDHLR